ncbi:MAG: T9SS type A sorting domain-containing protein [Crocinitomicaceae bacterium]|nr:T9SS type A sorting domain-containing protein [Crocinitomicaceae bacterium]
MKKTSLFLIGILFSFLSFGQATPFNDDMTWAGVPGVINVGGLGTSAQSPNFGGCAFNYTVSTNSPGSFAYSNNQADGSAVLFPANTGAFNGGAITITFQFSQPVTNLQIHIDDLDIAETVNNINPAANSVTATNGVLNFAGGVITSPANNADGWINWTGPVTTVSFTYTRPGVGFGLLVDFVNFTGPDMEANVSPVGHSGYTTINGNTMPTYCTGDAVFADASATSGESNYYMSVAPVIGFSPIVTGANMYSGWVTGQAPSALNLMSSPVGTATFTTDQVYVLTIATGPCWNSTFMYFVVQDCCPEDLELAIDCDDGTVNILNLPIGIFDVHTLWTHTLVQGGQKITTLAEGPNTISSVPTSMGEGWYNVTMTFTLPNGMECSYEQSIYFGGEEYCCEIFGPSLNLSASTPDGYTSLPDGTVLPFYTCGPPRMWVSTDCINPVPSSYYITLHIMNPNPWSVFLLHYWNPAFTPVGYFDLWSNDLPGYTGLLPDTWYLLTVCSGNACDYFSFYSGPECPHMMIDLDKPNPIERVKISPNPATDITTVEFEEVTSGTLVIRSTEGTEVFTTEFTDRRNIDVDVSSYPSGMYFIEIMNEDMIISERLIKN